ncbi:MAG TPA: PD-(D/E)XK nuclease family protein, partial [Fimbriimonadaceae bacterium]|nr:PD-(D/E)XK nuclease family protein [Fimbriimonadaceae bacterium]
MPRKPTLSPSRITTYLACPAKYRWTFQDPRGKWYLRSKSCYSFGSTLHKVLERFHDAGDCGVTTTYEALAALEESWLDAGFSSAEEMAEAYGEGKAIIEQHVEHHTALPVSSKTLCVERLFKKD